jgi:Ca2+/H+ antiporter
MLPFVAITLVLGYAPLPFHPNPIVLFVTSLFSITPVAYYIGMAVARFTASSFLYPCVCACACAAVRVRAVNVIRH